MKLCLLHVFLVMHLYVFLILAFFQQLFQTYLPIYFRASFEKMLCCGNMSNFSAGVYFTILNWFNTYERWRRALGTKVSPFTTFLFLRRDQIRIECLGISAHISRYHVKCVIPGLLCRQIILDIRNLSLIVMKSAQGPVLTDFFLGSVTLHSL